MTKLRQALRLDPENALASYNYGLALLFQNKPDEAITRFQAVLRSLPDHPDTLYFLARAYLAVDRPEDAAACLRKLIVMRPDDPYAHNGLGVALAKIQDWSNAAAEFKNARRLGPGNALFENNQTCIENHLQGCALMP
jgi:tetratricopeptide (TPR) repeat protein